MISMQIVLFTTVSDVPSIDVCNSLWPAIMAMPSSAVIHYLQLHPYMILGLCIVALLLSLGIGYLTAWWLLMPLRRLIPAIQALAQGQYDYRLPPSPSTPELATLAQAFNQMAEQLQTSFLSLQASEAGFKSLAANMPGVMSRYVLHADGSETMLYISPNCYALWSIDADNAKQDMQILWDLVHPEDLPVIRTSLRASAQTLETWCDEWRITIPSGETKWLQGAGNPTQQPNGDIVWDIIVLDISERKATEQALRDSEERVRQITENIQEVFWLSDADITQLLFISPAYEQIWGRSCQSLYEDPRSFAEAIHPEDREHVRNTLATHYGKAFYHEYRIVRPDGEIRWVADRGFPVLNEAGIPIRRAGVAQDITERKLAEIRLHQTTERERLVNLVTERIRRSLNLDDVLCTTVTEIRHLLQADRVCLIHLQPDNSSHVIQESVAEPWLAIQGQRFRAPLLHANSFQDLYQTTQTVTDVDDGSIPPTQADFLRQFQVKAKIAVPIRQADVDTDSPITQTLTPSPLWGLLVVHQCSQPRQWSENDIQILEQLANPVAIALQQSALYQQLQHLNASLEQQVQQRTADLQQALNFESLLQRMTDKVRETLDEQQVIQTAVDEVSQTLQIQGCGIGLFDVEQTTSTICYAELTAGVPCLHDRVFALSSYPELYQALLQGESLQFCGTFEQPYPTLPSDPKGTILMCPLMDNRGALGELWLYRIGDGIFSESEIRLAQQVANQCAIGIRQSRLYQAAQVQVQALEQLHAMKDDFLSTVSHELRSPLANIKMAIQMVELRLHQQDVQDDRLTQYLHILKDSCRQELSLINDLLDLQRLEAGMQSLDLEPIDLDQWLSVILEPFISRAEDRQQQLILDIPDHLPTMVTDASSLKRIVMELLHNACKYTPAHERIIVTAQSQETWFHLRVCNSGVNISVSELSRLFDKFYRATRVDQQQQGGTGLGLALTKRLVEHLHGTIQVSSTDTLLCFTVQLPLYLTPSTVLN